MIDKISNDMVETKNLIGAAVLNIKTTSIKELAGSINTLFNDIIVKAFERQASLMSDIAGSVTGLNDIIKELGEENDGLREELKAVKATRESQ